MAESYQFQPHLLLVATLINKASFGAFNTTAVPVSVLKKHWKLLSCALELSKL